MQRDDPPPAPQDSSTSLLDLGGVAGAHVILLLNNIIIQFRILRYTAHVLQETLLLRLLWSLLRYSAGRLNVHPA